MILQIVIGLFIFIESLNILMLYGNPASKKGNGVGVFNTYHEAMKEESTARFVSYLINWVAGAKLIFVMIGIVIIIFGNETLYQWTVAAFIISIASFYFRLYPLIKTMDQKGEISPKGYYKTLNYMIAFFIIVFAAALIISFL